MENIDWIFVERVRVTMGQPEDRQEPAGLSRRHEPAQTKKPACFVAQPSKKAEMQNDTRGQEPDLVRPHPFSKIKPKGGCLPPEGKPGCLLLNRYVSKQRSSQRGSGHRDARGQVGSAKGSLQRHAWSPGVDATAEDTAQGASGRTAAQRERLTRRPHEVARIKQRQSEFQ